jgi:hypothetical protein
MNRRSVDEKTRERAAQLHEFDQAGRVVLDHALLQHRKVGGLQHLPLVCTYLRQLLERTDRHAGHGARER